MEVEFLFWTCACLLKKNAPQHWKRCFYYFLKELRVWDEMQKCRIGTVEKSFQGNDNSSRAKGRLSIFTQYRSNCPWVKTEKFSSMHTGAGKCLRDPEKINTAPDGHSPNGLEYGIFQFIAECFTHKYLFVFQLLGVLISRAKVIVAHT